MFACIVFFVLSMYLVLYSESEHLRKSTNKNLRSLEYGAKIQSSSTADSAEIPKRYAPRTMQTRAEKKLSRIPEIKSSIDPYEVYVESILILETSHREVLRSASHGVGLDATSVKLLERAYSRLLGARSQFFGPNEVIDKDLTRFRNALLDQYLLDE